jgi:hypothetical protein
MDKVCEFCKENKGDSCKLLGIFNFPTCHGKEMKLKQELDNFFMVECMTCDGIAYVKKPCTPLDELPKIRHQTTKNF